MWCVIRVYQVQIGVWLTQINSIIKIFCAICGICERIDSISQKSRNKIINLNNQINLCETQTHHLRGNAPTINGCNHLIANDINRASGYIVNNPT